MVNRFATSKGFIFELLRFVVVNVCIFFTAQALLYLLASILKPASGDFISYILYNGAIGVVLIYPVYLVLTSFVFRSSTKGFKFIKFVATSLGVSWISSLSFTILLGICGFIGGNLNSEVRCEDLMLPLWVVILSFLNFLALKFLVFREPKAW
jgi:hypothetical protein